MSTEAPLGNAEGGLHHNTLAIFIDLYTMVRTMAKETTVEKKAPVKGATKAKSPQNDGTFAVIATGGKQYKVKEGQKIKIEKIIGEYKEGDSLTFDQVLLVDNGEVIIGVPTIVGAKVEAKLQKIGRNPKVTVIKYKQKSRYFKKNGHRQPYFEVEITGIK